MSFSKILTNSLPEKIEVPSSKSYANRALILAALSSRPIKVSNISWAQDVLDMVVILKSIGLKIKMGSDFVVVENSFPECETNINSTLELYLGEGGTTSRFIVGMLSLGKRKYYLKAKNKMSTRPMQELYGALSHVGASIIQESEKSFPITIHGPIRANQKVEIDCSETTQFYSSLLLISKKAQLEVKGKKLNTSKGYVEITKKLLESYDKDFVIPVDFSSASYPIAYSTLNHSLTITNCFERDFLQGDSIILEIIKNYGAGYNLDSTGLHINSTENFRAFEIDCSDCPDLVPTLCYLAAYAVGESKISNIANLRHKESDRIEELIKILKQFDVPCRYDETEDVLSITGIKKNHNVKEISTEYDHRMVMVATLFLKHNAGGRVSPKAAVNKSFPGFFDIF